MVQELGSAAQSVNTCPLWRATWDIMWSQNILIWTILVIFATKHKSPIKPGIYMYRDTRNYCHKCRLCPSDFDCLILNTITCFLSKTAIFCDPKWLCRWKVISGHTFRDPSELLVYVRRDPADQKYHCSICETFSHAMKSCARNHIESKHFPNIFTYICDLCEETFSTKTNLNAHRTRKHRN